MMANPFQGDDQDDFAAARDEEGKIKQTGLARTAKLSPFGLAFDTARKAGRKDFTFKGKKYTTEMAAPKKAAPAKATPAKAAPVDSKKDAADFKKIAKDTRAKADSMRTTANTILGTNKFKAPEDIETSPDSLSGPYKKGGVVKSSASKRADGIAIKGKTKGRFV